MHAQNLVLDETSQRKIIEPALIVAVADLRTPSAASASAPEFNMKKSSSNCIFLESQPSYKRNMEKEKTFEEKGVLLLIL